MPKILVTNTGFGQASPAALALLQKHGDVMLNEKGVKYDDDAMTELCRTADIIIAGTEKISARAIEGSSLRLIARVGVGVDSVALDAAKTKSVSVCYTPDAPSLALPEFTLTLMLSLIKHVPAIDREMHKGNWHRPMGRMLSSMEIGIIGAGKIGQGLIAMLRALNPHQTIRFYDPVKDTITGAQKASVAEILKHSDIVTLHLPYSQTSHYLISTAELAAMKKDAFLINTSRGGIVDEAALSQALINGQIQGAAFDVFEKEPYDGPLSGISNCLLTAHVGSMTREVRALMEDQVAEDVIRFINKNTLLRAYPGFAFSQN